MIIDTLRKLFAGIVLPAPIRKLALAALSAAIGLVALTAYQWGTSGIFSARALVGAIVSAIAALVLSALGIAIPQALKAKTS